MTIAHAADRTVDFVRERVGAGLIAATRPHPDTVRLRVDKRAVRAAADALSGELGARFMITAGIDRRELDDGFGIVHIFSLDREHLFVLLDCAVASGDEHIDSITPVVPAANWAEREFRDSVGVHPDGHPDPRRLLLADDWPDGVWPLRRDVPYNLQPPAAEGMRPPLREPPAGASVVTLGPFFPVLEEPSQWRLFVEGETIVGCDYRGFYNHRGIEKLAEAVLTYNEIPYLAERICGICGFIHSSCYCQAVEKAAGIEVPRRARFIRTVMLELERIHSHLLWLGIAGHIVGFDTVLMQTWRIREPVMWLSEEISGNRKTYGMNTIGGLRRDLSPEIARKALDVLVDVERESLAVRDAIVGDGTLMARTKDVGVLTNETAKSVCVVGPPARGSGVPIDARVDHPYAAYDEIPVRIAVHQEGDTWARVLVRVEELLESIRLVREALAAMPDGPVLAPVTDEIPPGRVGVSVVEAPRGEAVHMVETGGDNRPYRWRVRAPTYPNLQAMPAMVANNTIADVPIALGSLDPCFSCTERVETVDVSTKRITVYSREDLLRISRAGRARP
ncbi:MAG TPA: NADH-quinone oxidoreductase subunit C [Thermoanaerobaculaceae bacterium]|nr:NADH-quinone oxidoreductase subunit C [Thermoanaerobaculaceae bacterium]